MNVRNFVEFNADFPDDSEFAPSGDIIRPSGRNVADALCEHLRENNQDVTGPTQHSYYAWGFQAGPKGDSRFLLQFPGPYLLTCESRHKASSEHVLTLLRLVEQIVLADTRFSQVRWYTKAEYESGGEGSASPTA